MMIFGIGFAAVPLATILSTGGELFSGLFVSALDPAELSEAIEVSLAAGASGVSLFSSGAMSDEHWDSFRAALH